MPVPCTAVIWVVICTRSLPCASQCRGFRHCTSLPSSRAFVIASYGRAGGPRIPRGTQLRLSEYLRRVTPKRKARLMEASLFDILAISAAVPLRTLSKALRLGGATSFPPSIAYAPSIPHLPQGRKLRLRRVRMRGQYGNRSCLAVAHETRFRGRARNGGFATVGREA